MLTLGYYFKEGFGQSFLSLSSAFSVQKRWESKWRLNELFDVPDEESSNANSNSDEDKGYELSVGPQFGCTSRHVK